MSEIPSELRTKCNWCKPCGTCRAGMEAAAQEIERLEADNERLLASQHCREEEDAAMDIDIDRILKNLPPLTPGPASKALARMRQSLGMESGPVGEVVVRGADEIERLRAENELLEAKVAGERQKVVEIADAFGRVVKRLREENAKLMADVAELVKQAAQGGGEE